jgi:hypothetical protein
MYRGCVMISRRSKCETQAVILKVQEEIKAGK